MKQSQNLTNVLLAAICAMSAQCGDHEHAAEIDSACSCHETSGSFSELDLMPLSTKDVSKADKDTH